MKSAQARSTCTLVSKVPDRLFIPLSPSTVAVWQLACAKVRRTRCARCPTDKRLPALAALCCWCIPFSETTRSHTRDREKI